MIPKLYNLAQYLYQFSVWLATFRNPKASLWIKGRKNVYDHLKNFFFKGDNVIWIHVSSVGEFEQARPLIHQIKSQFPHFKLLLTFYSPSGYELRKDYADLDCVSYLPVDNANNAKSFIEIINPKYTFFVKYDFWPHYLNELQKRGYPHFIISAIFRPNQYFFKFYGTWMLDILSKVDHFFVQNNESKMLLNSRGINQVSLTRDTRFDQVHNISKSLKELPLVNAFKGESLLFLGGSTWSAGEFILKDFITQSNMLFKYVIAPHEIHTPYIRKLQAIMPGNVVLYSESTLDSVRHADILIIDNIGILSSIYRYADFAYVGGGFGRGIHNILEPASFGMPIFIGPNNIKFNEARELKELGIAMEIKSAKQMITKVNLLTKDSKLLLQIKEKSRKYISQNSGGTNQLMSKVFNDLLT